MHSPGLHFLPLRAAFAPTGAFVVRRILFFFLTPLNPQHAAADGTRRTADSGNRGRCTAAHNSAPSRSWSPRHPIHSTHRRWPADRSATARLYGTGHVAEFHPLRRAVRACAGGRSARVAACATGCRRPTAEPATAADPDMSAEKRCAPASRPPASRRKTNSSTTSDPTRTP